MASISVELKQAMMEALEELPPTTNGTEIQAIVDSGEDAFDVYPVIRVVPIGVNRTVDSDLRQRDYEIDLVLSVYLDLGKSTTPDSEVIDTLLEIVDSVICTLDETDWIPDYEGKTVLVGDAVTSAIDTTESKTGTALYCDITYPVIYRESI